MIFFLLQGYKELEMSVFFWADFRMKVIKCKGKKE